jgi:hypothetical protein
MTLAAGDDYTTRLLDCIWGAQVTYPPPSIGAPGVQVRYYTESQSWVPITESQAWPAKWSGHRITILRPVKYTLHTRKRATCGTVKLIAPFWYVCVCLFMSTYFYISCKYMCPYFPLLVWYHHIQTIYIDGTHYKWLIDFSQHASIPCHQQLYTVSPSNRSYVYVFNRLSVVNTTSLWVACHEILVV